MSEENLTDKERLTDLLDSFGIEYEEVDEWLTEPGQYTHNNGVGENQEHGVIVIIKDDYNPGKKQSKVFSHAGFGSDWQFTKDEKFHSLKFWE